MKSTDEDPAETLRPADYTGTSTDGIDDLDFNLEGFGLEANNIATDIGAICDYLESISWDKDKVEDSLIKEDIFLNMKLEDADYITSFANQYPYMLDRDKLWQVMRESVRDLRKEPTLENYTRIGNFQINMKSLKEDATPKSVTSVSDMNSMYESVNSINEYVQAINELSVASHLKMAIDKFSKTISDLVANRLSIATLNEPGFLIGRDLNLVTILLILSLLVSTKDSSNDLSLESYTHSLI